MTKWDDALKLFLIVINFFVRLLKIPFSILSFGGLWLGRPFKSSTNVINRLK